MKVNVNEAVKRIFNKDGCYYGDGFCSLFSCKCDNRGDCENCKDKLKYELHNNQEVFKEFIEWLEDRLISIDRDSFEPDKINCHIAEIKRKISKVYPKYKKEE